MLDFKRMIKAAAPPERGELVRLSTPWGETLDPADVLSEHPRPTMERDAYTMLNGTWSYAIAPLPASAGKVPLAPAQAVAAVSAAARPGAADGTILVPFSPEAPLSGARRGPASTELLWYWCEVELPALGADKRLVLHFEGVDWACAVYVDGRLAATHTGAYLPFDVDATDFLACDPADGAAAAPDGCPAGGVAPAAPARFELALCVYDPGSAGTQLRGKQTNEPEGIWYTSQSGIWQSVWYEVVPAAHVQTLSLVGGAEGSLSVDLGYTSPEPATLFVDVADAQGTVCASRRLDLPADASGEVRTALALADPHLWSPDDPYLYDVRLELAAGRTTDRVRSYCAFRTVAVERDGQGVARLFLNGEPLFLRGVLDQGYWPDGLLTAPSDEALVFDIQTARELGFNMLRKHIKVEGARWYYHCDRLGMLVWQDTPSGGGAYSAWWTSRIPTVLSATWGLLRDDTPRARQRLSGDDPAYREEWVATSEGLVRRLKGHPCIVTWALFNEGWGQFDAAAQAERVHALDPSRPVCAVSGWYDQRAGDWLAHHRYFRPPAVSRARGALRGYAAERGFRARIVAEFGGFTQPVEGHSATSAVFGYGDYDTPEAWAASVRALLGEAEALRSQGLAGFVYTQLTDVEGELNGLVTYDRRVRKL